MMLPPRDRGNDRVRFLHAVGKSTLHQGLTVPVSVQANWLKHVAKGESVPVKISFGDSESVQAVLRRINNSVGHLQFRYEAKEHRPLREYLRGEFAARDGQPPEPLEVIETGPREFRFQPLPGDRQAAPTLTICDRNAVYHNLTSADAKEMAEYGELQMALRKVEYKAEFGQREYNANIAGVLLGAGWRKEARLLDGLALRVDFERNGVWLELEFGNARAYYQDYIKFLLARRYRSARCGILLTPTQPFAHMLCQLGKKRALTRRRSGLGKPPVYSGMMTHEKAARELPFLSFFLDAKMIVAGIELSREMPSSR